MLSMVNDGSTDGSYDVMCELMTETHHEHEQDGDYVRIGSHEGIPMILVNRPKAQKQAAARNTAIQLAWENADLFMQLDADDLFLPGKVSKSVEAWAESPNYIGLVYTDAIIYNSINETSVREYRIPFERQLLERENIISNAPLISKLAFATVGFYDPDLPPCEDWDLWLRITEHFIAIHIPEALQQYTVTDQSCTFTVSEEEWNEQRRILLTKMMERTKKNG